MMNIGQAVRGPTQTRINETDLCEVAKEMPTVTGCANLEERQSGSVKIVAMVNVGPVLRRDLFKDVDLC
jgi:hypothetical protein